ncbi:ArsR family transcriptional regulator [Agathobaculum sp. NTUH-O15-33]|uniref:ArsR family transcriptional regulator n=1 Tax=Agathobaculum sp. NTUH-O15-33 TaxID=3079302 RepID=UPI002958A7D7|nr:ArsR family transcriptional regulator [Agathobaculum sp. NTUH-O15-33]WNX85764.1 ArsR family transcriptional regulator [Agathobaculum sp. NTUH-O15-33]
MKTCESRQCAATRQRWTPECTVRLIGLYGANYTIGEIAEILRVSSSQISRQLAKLRERGGMV